MAQQPKIPTLLISSCCQSLFSPPDWCFPPDLQYLSCGLNVQMSSTDRTLSPLKPSWAARGSMLKALGNARQESPEAAARKSAFQQGWSRKTAGKKPPSAVALSLLYRATSAPESSTASRADTSCGQWSSSSTGNGRFGRSVLCSTDVWKGIPAGKLIFGLVVYFSKANKPNIYIGLA